MGIENDTHTYYIMNMKQSILFAILSMFVLASCSSNAVSEEPKQITTRCGWGEELPELRGEVDSVLVVVCEMPDSIELKYSYKFNQRGDVEEWCSFNSDGTPCDKRIYKYDAEGRNTELAWYRAEGPYWQKSHYKYDAQGNMVESRSSMEDALLDRVLYKYDEHARKIEAISSNDENDCLGKICYKYSANGTEVETLSYDRSGKLTDRSVCKYDANGNVAALTYFDEEDMPMIVDSYNYDAQGNLVERVSLNWISQYQYKYDSEGNVVESREFSGRELALSRVTTFKIYYRQK